jgi:hypothetical protein
MSEEQPDYEQMSLEELEAELDKADDFGHPPEQEPEQPAGEPDPKEAEAQPEEQPEAPEDVPVEGDPATDQPPAEPEFDERDSKIEELQLQVEQQRLEREKFQFDRQRDSGRYGVLRQEMESLKGTIAGLQSGDLEAGDEQAARPPTAFQDPRFDEIVADIKQTKLQSAYQEFENSLAQEVAAEMQAAGKEPVPDEVATEVRSRVQAITPAIEQEVQKYANENLKPEAASRILSLHCKLAYGDWKIQRARTRNAGRRVSQIAKSRQAKLEATDDAGNPPVVKPQTKSYEDMTADEADAEMTRLYGRGGNRYRER